MPTEGIFPVKDELQGRRIDLDFCWIPLTELDRLTLYPEGIAADITAPPSHIRHFVYRE